MGELAISWFTPGIIRQLITGRFLRQRLVRSRRLPQKLAASLFCNMKCQKCEKHATFHITDLTGDDLLALHLCPDCAKKYLNTDQLDIESDESTPTISGVLSGQLKLEQTAEDLKELDSKQCPICGISFYEFRQAGRLGCPHDYDFFADELKPLLVNVHGDTQHVGKRPENSADDMAIQIDLIRMRREMKDAIEQEDYERASQLRDEIKTIERGSQDV